MTALREMKIQFLVAPYEAEAQLAYLCRTNDIQAVICDDSDIFVYGCPNVMSKMDRYGEGIMMQIQNCFGKGSGPKREVPEDVALGLEKIEASVEADLVDLRSEDVVKGVIDGSYEFSLVKEELDNDGDKYKCYEEVSSILAKEGLQGIRYRVRVARDSEEESGSPEAENGVNDKNEASSSSSDAAAGGTGEGNPNDGMDGDSQDRQDTAHLGTDPL